MLNLPNRYFLSKKVGNHLVLLQFLQQFVGKLQLQVDDLRGGINCFEKALKILSISHGENHELVKMLKESLQSACREMQQREEMKNLEDYELKWEKERIE